MLKIVSNTGTMLKEVTYRLQFTTSTFEHHRGTNYVLVQFIPVHLDNAQISSERLIYNPFTLKYDLNYPPVSLKLEVSLLPALTNGSIWKNQNIIYEPWFKSHPIRIQGSLLEKGARSFVTGTTIARYFDDIANNSYMDKYQTQFPSYTSHDYIGFGDEKQTVLIPKTEVMRYFYLSSTTFNYYVFTGKIQDADVLINGCPEIHPNLHLHLKLRKRIKDIDAFKIALLFTQKAYNTQLYKISNTISLNLNMDKHRFEINTFLPISIINTLDTLATIVTVDRKPVTIVHKIVSCNYKLNFNGIDIDRDNGGGNDPNLPDMDENPDGEVTPVAVPPTLPPQQGSIDIDNNLDPFDLLSRGIQIPEIQPNIKLNKIYRKREKASTTLIKSPGINTILPYSSEEGGTSQYIKAFKVEFIPEFAQDIIKELESIESLKITVLNSGMVLKNSRNSVLISIYDVDTQKYYYLVYTDIVPKSKINTATYILHFHDYHSDHSSTNAIFKIFLLTSTIEQNKLKYHRQYFKFREQSTLSKIIKYLGKTAIASTAGIGSKNGYNLHL